MNPGNGASSSILPGSEEGIGGRHGCPHTLAATVIYNEWIETLLTSMLDDTGLRLAVELAMARPKTAALWQRTNSHHFGATAWHIEPVGAQEGKPIPLGRALDEEGHPTTDPKAGLEGLRTKMSACQDYRRRDLAHKPGRNDRKFLKL